LVVVAQKEGISAEPALLHHIAQKSDGNVRSALQALDMARRAGTSTIESYLALSGEHDPAPALLAALMTGNHERIFSLLDEQLSTIGSPGQIATELVACIRDLFILKAGGSLSITGGGFESRRELALRLEQERLLFAVKALWEVKTRIRGAEDPRGTLELALILIAEAFTRGKGTPAPEVAPQSSSSSQVAETPRITPRKLSFAELQRER
jgi:DNA polymerase III gamma/tau subunit